MARKSKSLNTYDVRLRCVYDRPEGQQLHDDVTVVVDASDARQALALAVKLAPPQDKDGRALLDVSTHGLDMRPAPVVEEEAAA